MANTSSSTANGSPYDKIIDMIQRLDLQDDGIVMNHKIKSIECDFCSIVRDEGMLNESMEYINDKALHDGNTSLKFALLFSSRNFDSLAMNTTKVRSKMLKILELNYANADLYRSTDKNRFYNSITLLGEYYHRVRLADNSPITILGQSLLALLIREISGNDIIDAKLAKLILSQVTLNGDIMRVQHKDDLTQLLFHVRRNLIEQSALLPSTKALLLMTLDLYYSNFANLGHMLEEMYTKYLVQESEAVNGNGEGEEYGENQPKKWSELVSEDSFYETEGYCENSNVSDDCNSHSHPCEEPQPPSPQCSPPQRHQRHHGRQNHRDRGNNTRLNERSPPHEEEEERQQPPEEKPLPRWRAPRFNRPDDEHSANNNGRQNRRFSGSYDDDRHSVRSDGGSIRLYSINDRLRHSQKNSSNNGDGGWDRNNGGYQNFNGNSRGRGNGGGNRNFNFRNTYDRPPRFQKAEKMRNSIERDQWRNNIGGHPDDDNNSNVGDANSRSSSRARTLPRPPKGKFDSYNGGNRGQSPNSYRQNNRPQNSRNFSRSNRYSSQSSLASESSNTWDRRHNRRNFSNRQSPHAHHNEWEDTHSVHGQPEEDNWVNKDNNSELVRNARNTAKYMNYLSQK